MISFTAAFLPETEVLVKSIDEAYIRDLEAQMRWMTAAIGSILIAALATPAGAQQDLSEVAGKIKLKRPEGESVVIDQRSVSSKVAVRGGSDGEILLESTTRVADTARSISALIGETGSGEVFYDDRWRARVNAAGEIMDEARKELEFVAVPERLSAAYEKVELGSTEVGEGLEVLREAIAIDRPQFTKAKTQIAEGTELLDEAMAAMRVVFREEEAEKPAPSIDPMTANDGIRALCRGKFTEGSEGFSHCVATQEAAQEAITGRFAFNVGLDENAFNTIRNGCLYEWPDDLDQRDSCERRRMAAAARR